MEVMSESSLLRPGFSQPESDDDLSFVVLGHSLCPESSEELVSDLADAIETSVVSDTAKLNKSAVDQMVTSTPSFSLMHQMNQDLPPHTRDVSLNTVATNSVDLSPDEIQLKVDLLVEENIKLKETLHQNNLAMKKQYDTLVLWQDDVMSVHKSHKEKFAETKVYIEKLKLEKAELANVVHLKEAEITLLMEQLNELKATTNVQQIPQLEAELENIKKKNVELQQQLENEKSTNVQQIPQLEAELENAKKKFVELEQQLENEKLALANEMSAREILKQQFGDLQKELVTLKSNNEKLEKTLNKQKRESESLQKVLLDEMKGLKEKLIFVLTEKQNQEKIGEQLMAAQMHITELQLSSGKDQETINENEEKIQRLEKQIGELTADIDALHMQVDVYSKDFVAEQQAKTALGVEKEKIADDLRNIQKRNQKLHEEVERLKNNDYVYVGEEEAAAIPAPQQKIDYICPKCSRQYPNYAGLEDHVYRCIEIDNLF